MDLYIGCKIIEAEAKKKENRDGYVVRYPDGYVSWSPKEVFEAAYRRISPTEFNLLQDSQE